MSAQRVADRYAKSLIDLAQEQGKLERITEDVTSFAEVAKNRDFYLLLKSPIVNGSKKIQIMEQLFQGKYDEMTMAFLRILVNKGREDILPEIAIEYQKQYKRIKHISTVTITTAEPISAEAAEAIRTKLANSSETDTHVEVETAVDPSLIGGFVLEFDGKIYDASVSQKLEELKKDFTGNLYVSKVEA